jgi:hypothetical protein
MPLSDNRPLTLGRIAELRAGEVPVLDEYTQLLDAWQAWALYARDQGYIDGGHACRWIYISRGLYGTFHKGSHPTPQAAVLAALRGNL